MLVDALRSRRIRIALGALALGACAYLGASSIGRVGEIEPDDDGDVPASIEDYDAWLHEGRVEKGEVLGSLLAAWQDVAERPNMNGGAMWASKGPTPIVAGTSSYSGRTNTIAIDPTNPDIVYIGAALGGVWKSVDRGRTWNPLTDDQPSLAMGSIAINPVDPNVIYAGTGEQNFSGDSYYGAGVLRSRDGGATWTRLAQAELTLPTGGGATISRVAINPDDPNVVFVASNFGLYKSTDGGDTWALKLSARGQAAVHDLVLDPSNSQIVYATLGLPASSMNKGIHKSTDGGETWTRLNIGIADANIGRTNITIARSSPNILYAAVANPASGANPLVFRLKTTDGGQTWTRLAGCTTGCNQASYDLVISVDPTNPNIVYQGAVSMFRSTDGGATWPSRGSGHTDYHTAVFDQLGNVYIGSDGGVFRINSSPADQLVSLNSGGLSNTQYHPGVVLHPTDPAVAQGGSQDNGSHRSSAALGLSWRSICGGDGVYQAIDGPDGNPDNVAYCASQRLGLRKTTNAWATSASVVSGLDRTGTGFVSPYIIDPNNSQVLIAGTRAVYRTENGAGSWFVNSPQLTVAASAAIRCLAFAPSDSANTYYAGTTEGTVWRTQDAGRTWTNVSQGLAAMRVVYHIAVNPFDANTVYVELSGFGTSAHVYRSFDAGATWSDISSNLPNLPTPAFAVDPYTATPPILYVGTDLGVFRSIDDGASWQRYSAGFPNTRVEELLVNPNTGFLVAATHGRGMWQIGL